MIRPKIKVITLASGQVRYRFVADIGRDPATGKRRQGTHTFATRREAEDELARIMDLTRRGVYVFAVKSRQRPSAEGWITAADLLTTGRCTADCLMAYEVKRRHGQWTDEPNECTCHCGGEFHSLFVNVAVPLPGAEAAS